ncbi:MAG: hypothetical protein AB7E55_00005, partial [Pigmentiphaga sp.]
MSEDRVLSAHLPTDRTQSGGWRRNAGGLSARVLDSTTNIQIPACQGFCISAPLTQVAKAVSPSKKLAVAFLRSLGLRGFPH